MYTKHIFGTVIYFERADTSKKNKQKHPKKNGIPTSSSNPQWESTRASWSRWCLFFFPRRSQSSAALWRLTPWCPLGVREVVLKHTGGALEMAGLEAYLSIPIAIKEREHIWFQISFYKSWSFKIIHELYSKSSEEHEIILSKLDTE